MTGSELPCTCPYCGHKDSHDEFWTQDQLKLIESEVHRQVVDPVINEWSQGLEKAFRSSRYVRFKAHRVRTRKHSYSETELETPVTCDNCTLVYAVYGVFAFCPDCGQHNSLQMLCKNIGIVNKMLERSAASDDELRQKDIENALKECVSAFDAFGRELCRVQASKCSDPAKLDKLSFQNLEGVKQKVLDMFGIDFAEGVAPDEWKTAVRGFQKRHLFAHKMGVIDAKHVERSGDPHAVVGHKTYLGKRPLHARKEMDDLSLRTTRMNWDNRSWMDIVT